MGLLMMGVYVWNEVRVGLEHSYGLVFIWCKGVLTLGTLLPLHMDDR